MSPESTLRITTRGETPDISLQIERFVAQVGIIINAKENSLKSEREEIIRSQQAAENKKAQLEADLAKRKKEIDNELEIKHEEIAQVTRQLEETDKRISGINTDLNTIHNNRQLFQADVMKTISHRPLTSQDITIIHLLLVG